MADRSLRLVAVVPVRTLEGAKSRLGDVLDPEERQDLVVRLLARTIAALGGAADIAEILVVSPDRTVRTIADGLGARTLAQHGPGLNRGLEEARADAIAGGAEGLLVIPGDLPAITPEAIEALAVALATAPPPAVILVPDRHGRGTNALGLIPPDVIDFAFGGDSRAAHAALAAATGAAYRELDGPLTLDLDTPDDLLAIEVADPTLVPR